MSAPPDEVLAAMAHAARGFSSDTFGIGRIKAALAAADALGWVLVPAAEAESLNEIRRMVEHCRKMEGDDQLHCFLESAVAAFNDRDTFAAEARALRAQLAAAPKVGER